jgi:hypothetical protein
VAVVGSLLDTRYQDNLALAWLPRRSGREKAL